MSTDDRANSLHTNGSEEMLDQLSTLPADQPAEHAASLIVQQQQAAEGSLSSLGTLPTTTRAAVSAAQVPGYEIVRELGRGGMGVVYLARQAGLGRLVALKMVLAGGHAGEIELRRFRTEAEAVARLQHPNIVQVFEVGEHEGLPFLSLEFCAGKGLDKKLAGSPLPPEEAATLAETLARAMQAAHAANVIHRDLKPANVLLAADGTPKITDFGLAKKLDEASQTHTGAVLGTPSYMAPEQADGRKAVGPAADVYSLGAILYECLTGRPPFKAATAIDTLKQLATQEPVPPRQLNARVPVDLETICLKCLQKEPLKRYASAEALADDLARFRAGQPVKARPVGAVERGWRWCRRNPALAGSLSLVGVSLLAASVVSMLFALRAEQARRAEADRALSEAAARQEALEERDRAQKAQQGAETASDTARKQERIARKEAQNAKEFSDLLLGVFESADPTGLQGYTAAFAQVGSSQLTAREILDRAVARIKEQGHPENRTAQLTSIGNIYRSLGLYKQAGQLLEQAYALRRKDSGTPQTDIAESLFFLGWLYHEQGQYPKARQCYREALEIRRKLDPNDPKVTQTLFNMGWLEGLMGEYERAEMLFLEVIARRQKQYGTKLHRDIAVAKAGLALLYLDSGQVAKVVTPGLEAITAFRKLSPNDKLGEAVGLFMTAYVLNSAGQHSLAAATLKKCLKMVSRELGENHLYVGLIVFELAGVLESQSRYAEAEKYYDQCLRIIRNTAGLGHPRVLLLAAALARCHNRKGEFKKTSAIFDEVLQAHQERFGADHPLVADVYVIYAGHVGGLSMNDKMKMLKRAVSIYETGEKKYAMRSKYFRPALRNLAFACRQTKSLEEGLRVGLKRIRFFPNDSGELYDNACELALSAELAEQEAAKDSSLTRDLPERCASASLDSLAQAIGKGFNDPRRLLLEPRLASLQSHSGWTALLDKLPRIDMSRLQIHRGRLTEQDPFDTKRSKSRCKTYNIRMDAGKSYQLDLLSVDFDAFLRVETAAATELASDDNSGGGLNARVAFTPERPGTYRVIVTSARAGQTGYYVLGIEDKGAK